MSTDIPNARLYIKESRNYPEQFLKGTICDECGSPLLNDIIQATFLVIEPIEPHHRTPKLRHIHTDCFIPPHQFERNLNGLIESIFGWTSLTTPNSDEVKAFLKEVLDEQVR